MTYLIKVKPLLGHRSTKAYISWHSVKDDKAKDGQLMVDKYGLFITEEEINGHGWTATHLPRFSWHSVLYYINKNKPCWFSDKNDCR